MNILFYIGSLNSGGAERVICNLSNYLSDKHEVEIITTSFFNNSYYKLRKKIVIKSLDNNKNTKNFFLKNIKRIYRLKKYIKDIKPDIIVSFLPEQNYRILFLKRILNIPVIVSERSDPNEMYKKFIFKKLMKLLYPKANGYVFQTEKVKEYFLERGMQEKKAKVIANPLNKEFVNSVYFGSREKTIVSVGRLEEVKNFKLLIEAFLEVRKEFKEYQLIIYGEGTLHKQLNDFVKHLGLNGSVFLPGNKNNIKKYIEKATLFVLTSNYEGLPNALMEALALGIPSISTDCASGGPRSLIKEGYNGFLVPVGGKEELIKKMLYLLRENKLRETISENAYKSMKKYQPEIIYNEWEKFIVDISNR